jgi:predicted DNA-binding ribbon-helix-helix protein
MAGRKGVAAESATLEDTLWKAADKLRANNALTTAEVITELVALAKEVNADRVRQTETFAEQWAA